jgi:hypothetical protein
MPNVTTYRVSEVYQVWSTEKGRVMKEMIHT